MITDIDLLPGELPVVADRIPTAEPSWTDETDVIIVGTGAAGLAAAVRLLDAGRRTTLITKGGEVGDGSTAWAQGGLAAVLGVGDSLDSHTTDTLNAGAGLCERGPVGELIGSAPDAIRRLIALGANFDLDRDGRIALGLEGGHRHRRIVHAGGDASGAEVARALTAAVRLRARRNLRLHQRSTVVDLLRDHRGVYGVRLLDADGAIGEIAANAVVLASGGIGQAWDTTTNPVTATGDGLALAARSGAVLRDVEFVQFHPTVLVVPEAFHRPGDRGVLISEAVRGEGAVLVDRRGELIMKDRHPLADLAPRDVVSATMHAHLMATGDDHLFLDGTRLGERVWQEHFPSILGLCRARGVDPVREPIPVRPAEHYSCGGVVASLDGVTSVPGLFAVGEVASTGVQGANRLASNSLTEALIAGDRVGALLISAGSAQARPGRPPALEASSPASAAERDRWSFALEASSGCAVLPHEFHTPDPPRDHPSRPTARDYLPSNNRVVRAEARNGIVAAVSAGAGVLREESGLSVMLKSLDGLPCLPMARTAADVESTNLHAVAVLIGAAAMARTESRGCHRRADYPEPDPRWERHTLVRLGAEGLMISTQEKESE